MVQVIKHPDTYKCEVCGEVYVDEWRAKLCESLPLQQPAFPIGAIISFHTRYDGLVKDEVVGHVLIRNNGHVLLSNSSGISLSLECIKQLLEKGHIESPHSYAYVVSNHHQLGKDWKDNTIPSSFIVP